MDELAGGIFGDDDDDEEIEKPERKRGETEDEGDVINLPIREKPRI